MIPNKDGSINMSQKAKNREILQLLSAHVKILEEKLAITEKAIKEGLIESNRKRKKRIREETYQLNLKHNGDAMQRHKKWIKGNNNVSPEYVSKWRACKMCKRTVSRTGRPLRTKYYDRTTCQYCYRKVEKANKEQKMKALFSERKDD